MLITECAATMHLLHMLVIIIRACDRPLVVEQIQCKNNHTALFFIHVRCSIKYTLYIGRQYNKLLPPIIRSCPKANVRYVLANISSNNLDITHLEDDTTVYLEYTIHTGTA